VIVRITRKQLDQLGVCFTDAHYLWANRAVPDSKQMINVAMPPIGWRTLADEIPKHAFGPIGGRKHDNYSLGSALRRISKGLVALEGHPAFKTAALPGRHFEMFLAWGDSPYPRLEAEPSMLYPHTSEAGGIVMTQWRRHYDTGRFVPLDPLYEPGNHWAFMPPPASPTS
jgi:hypothetical protein